MWDQFLHDQMATIGASQCAGGIVPASILEGAMITSRRALLTGAGALLIAGPAIVKSSSIMPVRPMLWTGPTFEPGRFVHIAEFWPDGSYFKETADMVERTSSIEWGIGKHWGPYLPPRELSFQKAEQVRRSIESVARSGKYA